MELTAAQMIDMASMRAIYGHLQNDPEITDALQVFGEKKDLAQIGEWFINGNKLAVEQAFAENKIKFYKEAEIQIDNAILCLYLPPFYLFIDLKTKYE